MIHGDLEGCAYNCKQNINFNKVSHIFKISQWHVHATWQAGWVNTNSSYTPVKLVYLGIPSSKTCLFRHYHQLLDSVCIPQ